MRLYGTVGPIPTADAPAPGPPDLVASADIHDLLLDGARRVLTGRPPPVNPGEER